jgi:hypothetical protein
MIESCYTKKGTSLIVDLAPVLQYGSGPSPAFLSKIGVAT